MVMSCCFFFSLSLLTAATATGFAFAVTFATAVFSGVLSGFALVGGDALGTGAAGFFAAPGLAAVALADGAGSGATARAAGRAPFAAGWEAPLRFLESPLLFSFKAVP